MRSKIFVTRCSIRLVVRREYSALNQLHKASLETQEVLCAGISAATESGVDAVEIVTFVEVVMEDFYAIANTGQSLWVLFN